jgi:hypothetical protein
MVTSQSSFFILLANMAISHRFPGTFLLVLKRRRPIRGWAFLTYWSI